MSNYDNFMKQYRADHELCPKCGYKIYITTMKAYFFDNENPDNYKNLNSCQCKKCGNWHKTHERISITKFNEINNK